MAEDEPIELSSDSVAEDEPIDLSSDSVAEDEPIELTEIPWQKVNIMHEVGVHHGQGLSD